MSAAHPLSEYGNYDNAKDFEALFGDVVRKDTIDLDAGWSIPYEPRPQMVAFHQRTQRFAFLICHRRFGKTVGCVAELIIRALYTTKKNAQYAYVCPFRTQAKAVAWNYLVEMTQGVAVDVKVSELSVTLYNGSKIWLSGSDNVNALRGLYLDGCVLDEFAQCRPDLLEAVIMPCLLDRKGWLVIIGTAYGRLNQFYEKYQQSQESDDWFHADIKVYDSGVIPHEEIERIRNSVSDAKFKQEFLNDFSAELKGTYYADQLHQLETSGHLVSANDPDYTSLYNPELDVQVAFDIGRGDNTVAWFWQETPHGVHIIDYYTNNGEQAQHYIDMLKQKPYRLTAIHLPHDAKAKTFATHKSALEQFVYAFEGTDTDVQIVPRLSVEDGIEAVRQLLRHTYFDYDKCYYGVECLRVYRKKWDEVNQCYSKTPLHDYSSDSADSFRYLAIQANKKFLTPPEPIKQEGLAPYSLDDLFAMNERSQPSYSSKRL